MLSLVKKPCLISIFLFLMSTISALFSATIIGEKSYDKALLLYLCSRIMVLCSFLTTMFHLSFLGFFLDEQWWIWDLNGDDDDTLWG